MNDISNDGQDPQISLERKLKDSDMKERQVSSEFLEMSRPNIIAGRRLPWDSFWTTLARGFDGMLWRWFGGDVEVARAQEQHNQRQADRKAKKINESVRGPDSKQ